MSFFAAGLISVCFDGDISTKEYGQPWWKCMEIGISKSYHLHATAKILQGTEEQPETGAFLRMHRTLCGGGASTSEFEATRLGKVINTSSALV